MLLIDTSSWIHFFRPDGDPPTRSRVEAALRFGQACWCPVVQLELWNGARGDHEQLVLARFREALPSLPMSPTVWDTAFDLASRARSRGIRVPAADIAIAACAVEHRARLESADRDFDWLDALRDPAGA